MEYKSFLQLIEAIAPLDQQASWDRSGLLVSSTKNDISKVGLALEPSLSTVIQAIDLGCDLLLTHHPLGLTPRFPAQKDNYFYVLQKLLQADMFLYSAHTSLDVNVKGPVGWFARELELNHVQIIEEVSPGFGFGLIGDLSELCTGKSFIARLKTILNLDLLRCVGRIPANIQRVGYCPGSGGELTKQAFALGADVFITGDVKYHQAVEVETLGLIVDVGHFVLEEKMMFDFYQLLTQQVKTIEFVFIQGKEPFFYL